jgi:hypothetical protein
VRSCGPPTPTDTGSPRSPPTPPAGSRPTWSCGTAAGPAARTGSEPPRTPGLRNLPLHDFAQNQLWCAIVALACELTSWTQMLALPGHQARRREPKRLRLRLFSIAGRLATTGRRTVLHLSGHAPWAQLATTAITTLRLFPAPG